jgi:hypothetical protein
MAFANSDISDVVATTIESRTGVVADNVTDNNALLLKLKQRGRIKPWRGGYTIRQELSFQDNATAKYYSGGEVLDISPSDVISAAQYDPKQAVVAVTITGLEMLQNTGEEQIIDLLDARIEVGESSLQNLISAGIYGDGTSAGGKAITGLQAQVVTAPGSGIVGGINRGTWGFWRNQVFDFSSQLSASASATNIMTGFNTLYARCTRGTDHPDLVILDNVFWGFFLAAQQSLQRYAADGEMAKAGFTTLKYMNADIVLDGGIGGNCPTNTGYFLNTKFLHWRPHSERNFTRIGGQRVSTNQDAIVELMGWAGNLTASGLQFQGILFE